MSPSKKEDIVYKDTTLAVKSVMVGGAYLHRVRVWDKGTGELLVAMRMWSNTPYARGTFIKMQPDTPPEVARILREAKEREVKAELDAANAEVEADGPARAAEEAWVAAMSPEELKKREGEVTRTGEGS